MRAERRRLLRLYRKLLRGCGALGLAGSLLLPAATSKAADEVIVGGGLYVSFRFGERSGVGFGLEGFATYLLQGNSRFCGDSARAAGIGPLLQFGLVNMGDPRLVIALHGGGELAPEAELSLSAEIGGTYRFGDQRGFGLHLGLTPQLAVITGFGRAAIGLQEYSAGVGLRSSSLYGNILGGCVIEGRPLRSDHGIVDLAAVNLRDTPAAQAWARSAQSEHASVLAFAELGQQLIAAEAPPSLITRALRAGQDEIRHTIGAAKLARRFAGEELDLRAPSYSPRAPLGGRAALMRLAIEAWIDGCLNEGAASCGAELAAARTTDDQARALQTTIAREEAEHATLAWDILSWACSEGGDDVRHEVWKLRDHEPQPALEEEDQPRSHGRLTAAEKQDALEKHLENSRRKLLTVGLRHAPEVFVSG